VIFDPVEVLAACPPSLRALRAVCTEHRPDALVSSTDECDLLEGQFDPARWTQVALMRGEAFELEGSILEFPWIDLQTRQVRVAPMLAISRELLRDDSVDPLLWGSGLVYLVRACSPTDVVRGFAGALRSYRTH
jgi:hypothetical protein